MVRGRGYGIHCLEREWRIKVIFTRLKQLGIADSVHRDVATWGQLDRYIGRFRQKRYADHKVLCVAMHGDVGCVSRGRDQFTRADLEAMLCDAGMCKAVCFGSRPTLMTGPKRLQVFAKQTGARAVVGYRKEIERLQGAAFDELLLDWPSMGWRSDALCNHLGRDHGAFAKSLGLVVTTKAQVHRVSLSGLGTSVP